ncbi:MAG: neutral/alkaline non-lysosomal ceramidase N-terminal domain-containing protein [Verrucomicrobia bacterium]|nr:neutral/alkaline non-lysosomal ceramidase N-terminal domain-containing protein [Verrucomicrobiota bacterium]
MSIESLPKARPVADSEWRGRPLRRREFLTRMLLSSAVARTALAGTPALAAPANRLQAGEARIDITPPLGITMGGFHYPPTDPRLITGIRARSAARALVLRAVRDRAAIISFDMLNISRAAARRVRERAGRATGIPTRCVHVCATHTHSMPSIAFNRQWGDQHPEYFAEVERKIVEVVRLAQADLAPADLAVGRSRTVDANFNRTASPVKTDADFTQGSSDDDRWLDTSLHVLHFERAAPKRNLLWYHFSAHPVCFNDRLAGPDWPGLVEELAAGQGLPAPSFLQGHIGDVNPGKGDPWLGRAEDTAPAVLRAVREALQSATRVNVRDIRVATGDFPLPLDLALFRDQIARYRSDPSKCTGGEWVDAAFAKDWHDTFAAKWNFKQSHLPSALTAMRLGDVGLVFHGAELYSFYGLAIRRDSPLPHTLVIGYADGYVGYLPDPNAYRHGEYAAVVVPKILNFPPFTPTAARELAAGAVRLLRKVAS